MMDRRKLITGSAALAAYAAISGGAKADSLPFFPWSNNPQYNWGASNFSVWRSAKARVKAGSGRARVLCVGDSTTAGVGSNNSALGLKSLSYPTVLATQLASLGLPTSTDSFYGTNNQSPYGTFNPQVSVGSGWAGSGTTMGAAGFGNSTTTASPLAFTPAAQVDTFELTYLTQAGNGILGYAVDSGSVTNVNCNGATALNKLVISATLGSHTLNLTYVSGGAVTIFGVVAYNSAVKAVDIINVGWGSSTTIDWNNNSSAFRARPAIQFQAADLIIIQLGINDWTPGTLVSVPTYISNLNAIVGDNISASSIVLMTPVSSINTRQVFQIQENYVAALYGIAFSQNIPLWDLWNYWGPYPQSPSFYFSDGVHGSTAGYANESAALASSLAAA